MTPTSGPGLPDAAAVGRAPPRRAGVSRFTARRGPLRSGSREPKRGRSSHGRRRRTSRPPCRRRDRPSPGPRRTRGRHRRRLNGPSADSRIRAYPTTVEMSALRRRAVFAPDGVRHEARCPSASAGHSPVRAGPRRGDFTIPASRPSGPGNAVVRPAPRGARADDGDADRDSAAGPGPGPQKVQKLGSKSIIPFDGTYAII